MTQAYGCGITETINRVWIALAGLAAVGVAAVALDLRDYAAGRMTEVECADMHAQLAANEARDPASVKFARDIFRLGGTCAPRDMAGAMRDIEAALRADLHESAILLYASTILNLGQGKRAAPWIRPAVAVALTSKGELAGPFGDIETHEPWLLRTIDRTRANLDSGEVRRIAGELETILSNPPRTRHAEQRLAWIGLKRLERADPRESLYWRGRLLEWRAEFFPESVSLSSSYPRAIHCGDRRAIRRLGTLYLEGKADDVEGRSAFYGLVLILDPTVEERALLAALEPRFGKTPVDMSDPLNRESWKDIHAVNCEINLRFIANRNR